MVENVQCSARQDAGTCMIAPMPILFLPEMMAASSVFRTAVSTCQQCHFCPHSSTQKHYCGTADTMECWQTLFHTYGFSQFKLNLINVNRMRMNQGAMTEEIQRETCAVCGRYCCIHRNVLLGLSHTDWSL